MEIDPHTIQHLLEKIRSQLRCPQCTKRVDVRFDSLKVMGDSFAVLQMQCNLCGAYILLHATLVGMHPPTLRVTAAKSVPQAQKNVSTALELDTKELSALRASLKGAQGRFSELFEENA